MLEVDKRKALILKEIEKVRDEGNRRFLRDAIERFPEYYWTAPASVTHFHPPDEREEGGLVLHVRRLCKLVEDIVYMKGLNSWEQDVLLSAAILHDSFSKGLPPSVSEYSDPLHPIYVEHMFPFTADAERFLDRPRYEAIMECVVSHSGRFSPIKSVMSEKKLPTLFQMVDFIGSRPHVEVKLD